MLHYDVNMSAEFEMRKDEGETRCQQNLSPQKAASPSGWMNRALSFLVPVLMRRSTQAVLYEVVTLLMCLSREHTIIAADKEIFHLELCKKCKETY